MRWFVEVSRVGENSSDEKYCVEAKQWQAALQEAREETRTCVIVAEVQKHRYGPGSEVWWDVAPAEVTGIAETQAARKEYEATRVKRQRLHY